MRASSKWRVAGIIPPPIFISTPPALVLRGGEPRTDTDEAAAPMALRIAWARQGHDTKSMSLVRTGCMSWVRTGCMSVVRTGCWMIASVCLLGGQSALHAQRIWADALGPSATWRATLSSMHLHGGPVCRHVMAGACMLRGPCVTMCKHPRDPTAASSGDDSHQHRRMEGPHAAMRWPYHA